MEKMWRPGLNTSHESLKQAHTQTDAHLTQRGVSLSPKQPSPSKAEHTAWSQTSFTSNTSYRAFLLLQKPLLQPLFHLPLLLFSPYPWYAYSSLPFHLFCSPHCPDFSLFISGPFLLSPLFSLSAFLIPSIVFSIFLLIFISHPFMLVIFIFLFYILPVILFSLWPSCLQTLLSFVHIIHQFISYTLSYTSYTLL